MKKGIGYKSAVVFMSLCMSFGAILSLSPSYVEAQTVEKNGVEDVKLVNEGNLYTFGNGYITRTFDTSDGHLSTKNIINYRTGENSTVFTPKAGSEEFVINTLENGTESDEFVAPNDKLDMSGWSAEADSIDTGESPKGANSMFDGDDTTYYHSNYKDGGEVSVYPHNIYLDMGSKNKINSLRYQQRLYNGEPTTGGRVKDFKVYTAESMKELKQQTEPVLTGTFENTKETYINFDKEVETQYIRIEFVNNYTPSDSSNPNVAACSELNFYSDKATFPENKDTMIKSSDLTLNGEPKLQNIDGGKTLTFSFNPVSVRNVEYTIKEVITMYEGDSFMRKHLNISVPEGQEQLAKIDYIDLENLNIDQAELVDGEYWTISELDNNSAIDMGDKSVGHELGQPFYLGAMYWGSEFPETENKIRNNNGFIRYHYGKTLDPGLDKFENYQDNPGTGKVEKGNMTTWPAVVGAARSKDYQVVQSDFYEYIDTIALKTDLRQQFNSWYDYQKNITSTNILDSFYEIEKGFTQHGVEPLDSYVVDDGWTNYSSFWDFNEKFPHQLYDSSLQVSQFGSNFGLWLGPRGGYGTEGQIAQWIEKNGLGSRNWNSGGDINVSDARYLNKLVNDVFLNYQNKFDINYWKLDGMLLHPSKAKTDYHVTGKDEYVFTETFERWTDILEMMREQRGGKDLWINMTSYTNPSPWLLQWVNSIFMQDTGDMGVLKVNGNDTMEQQYLNYRDSDYYEFFNEIQWQLPAKNFYSHDPIYAKDTMYGKSDFTDEEFREYLYFLGTRGTAFWEYYFSSSIINEDKWEINAEAANWIKDNFDILQKSKMFGGKPSRGEVYGYSCWNGNEGIVSLRNPSDKEQTYTLTYDRLVGVSEGIKGLYGKVILGDQKRQSNETLNYGDTITYTLKPKEVLIMQYGEKDVTSAKVDSIHSDGKTIEVEFDETIQAPDVNNFSVEGNKVTEVTLKDDRRTALLTLENEIENASNIKVEVNGVLDTVGNVTKTEVVDDYYEDDIINSVVSRDLDGNPIYKAGKYSVDGKEGFSITGKIQTESKGVEILSQKDAYSVGIDKDGYLTFTLNGVTASSKYIEKLIDQNDKETVVQTTKGLIADGKEHQFTVVKEVNGLLKVYVDGKIAGSAYDKDSANPIIEKNDLVFADGLVGKTSYISVIDRALAYDEVDKLVKSEKNIMLAKENPDIKISAWDNTTDSEASLNKDKPVDNLNNGVSDNSNDYFELGDTSDGQKHSRYIQIDLGKEYELNRLKLTRYFSDGRTYGPTVIALSEQEDFSDSRIVYNSDKENVHKLGKGTDELYVETAQGKEIQLKDTVNARYIRIYVNGNMNNSTSDHIVEFEAYTNSDENALYRIDYSYLEELIGEDLSREYTTASINAYNDKAKDTISKAQDLLEKQNAVSDKEVEVLVENLMEHRKVLEKKADVSNAKALLDELNKKDLNESYYKETTWNSYSDAKTELEKAVKDNSNINENQINQLIEKVKKAYVDLEYKDADYSKVDAAIEKAESLNPKDYKDFSGVENAINAVVRGKNITEQEDVDAMAQAIEDAIRALVKIDEVDKTTLYETLLKYSGYHAEDYTIESWTPFKKAYDEASEVYSDNATQEEVNNAVEELEKAAKNLVKAEKPVDPGTSVDPEDKPGDSSEGTTAPDKNKTEGVATGVQTNAGMLLLTSMLAGAGAFIALKKKRECE